MMMLYIALGAFAAGMGIISAANVLTQRAGKRAFL